MKEQGKPHNRRSEGAPGQSREQYLDLFNRTPCAILLEDCSKAVQWLDQLREDGVTDIRQYLSTHTEEVAKAFSMIKVLDANDAAIRMFEADRS